MPTLAERVAAGAAFLDEHQPGWERLIDLEQLNLADGCRCVLGQIEFATSDLYVTNYGGDKFFSWDGGLESGYHRALERLSLTSPDSHGFELGSWIEDNDTVRTWSERKKQWEELDEAWISLIKDRFDSGNLSDTLAD